MQVNDTSQRIKVLGSVHACEVRVTRQTQNSLQNSQQSA